MIPKPDLPSTEFDRLAELAAEDDELEKRYLDYYQPFYAEMAKSLGHRALDLGHHALEKDALEVDPLRYPLPTQAHLDAYAAEYGKPQAEPNPTKPLRKRKRPSYWDESPF